MLNPPCSLTIKSRYVVQRLLLSRNLALKGKVQKLLDVGCGDGMLLSLIGDDVEKHGVDILEHISESDGPVNYLRHDVSSGLPYPDGTFDVVHSSELIEHLLDTEFFLRECHRVLKPGGKLVVSTPNLHYWRNIVEWFRGNQFFFVDFHAAQIGHVRYFCPKTIAALAQRAGFRNIITKTIGDWGGDNVLLKTAARLFQVFSTTKNLILFLVATKEDCLTVQGETEADICADSPARVT
jgi:SAM-dependent methyltransferase